MDHTKRYVTDWRAILSVEFYDLWSPPHVRGKNDSLEHQHTLSVVSVNSNGWVAIQQISRR